jgi:pantoate--beta-alanine ligase
MDLITNIKQMQDLAMKLKGEGKTIGLVPTMGYLHEGHLSLAVRARQENDIVVMSNFVNPLQFGPKEDFATYPRDLDRDNKLAEGAGVDYVFAPSGEEMYPECYSTYVEVKGGATEKMCGRSRPGHFLGVTTVVLKLFLITQPSRAYFGQKDAQQAIVIRKMVTDLNLPLEIITCPIVRERDGLALSSRNTYLSPQERRNALALPNALAAGRQLIQQGERSPVRVREEILRVLESSPGIRVDYVEVVDGRTLEEQPVLQGSVLLAAAVFVGKTRLIDNIDLEVVPCTAVC